MINSRFMAKLLDGAEVEWKALEEVAIKISSGSTPKTGVAEYYNGDIPWLRTQEVNFGEIWDTGVKITEAGLKNSSANWIPVNCVIIAMYGATVGKIGINKIPMTTNQACANVQLDENIVNYQYVFHFLSSQYKYIKSLGAGSQTNINAGIVKKLQIPIPCPDNPKKSLEIQAEIVRILDTFTSLSAELNIRKKQYNYYRDMLLSFTTPPFGHPFSEGELNSPSLKGWQAKPDGVVNVEWKALGDVTNYEQPTKYLVSAKNYSDEFETPVLTAGKTFILGYTDEIEGIYKASKSPVIIFDDFTTANKWVDFDFKVKSSAMKMITSNDESKVLIKYIYYWLNTLPSELVDGDHKRQWIGTFSGKKIPIPCPNNPQKSLEIQAEIVRILDNFTELTAELTARKKQYAYYRDLLLSFPKGGNL